MDYARLAQVLPQFIGQELLPRGGETGELTITDFRLGIRHQNLTEVRSWSSCDLDLMEEHAAHFDGDASLDCVLELPPTGASESAPSLTSSLGSPSPFAWT